MNKKEQLYYLFETYHQGNYDLETFCDELLQILYYESNAINELEIEEREQFEALAGVAKRYSPFEEDRKIYSWYIGEDIINEAIDHAYSVLVKKEKL